MKRRDTGPVEPEQPTVDWRAHYIHHERGEPDPDCRLCQRDAEKREREP